MTEPIFILITESDEPVTTNGTPLGDCYLCEEAVRYTDRSERIGTPTGVSFAHAECLLREVMGGIGHLIAHEYWCLQRHDTNAGLTRRQSAQMVAAYYSIIGPPA